MTNDPIIIKLIIPLFLYYLIDLPLPYILLCYQSNFKYIKLTTCFKEN